MYNEENCVYTTKWVLKLEKNMVKYIKTNLLATANKFANKNANRAADELADAM